MSIVFLNGWGVTVIEAVDAFKTVHAHSPVVVQPTSHWQRHVCAEEADTLVAYSTGAFLALGEPEIAERFKKVILLAPFVDFRVESDLGGKVGAAQLKYLMRWLRREPLAAVNDFRSRAGISDVSLPHLPAEAEDLIWGIERLAADSRPPESLGRYDSYLGDSDPLLDAESLSKRSDRVTVLPGVGHRLDALLLGARASL